MKYYLLIGDEVKEVLTKEWVEAAPWERDTTVKQTEVLGQKVETRFNGEGKAEFTTKWLDKNSDPVITYNFEDSMYEHCGMIQNVRAHFMHDKEISIGQLFELVDDLRHRVKQLEDIVDDLTQNND